MSRLYKADVDDHINFVRTVLHRNLCLEHLHRGGPYAVGKSDYGADSQLIPTKSLCLLHITGGMHRGGGVSSKPSCTAFLSAPQVAVCFNSVWSPPCQMSFLSIIFYPFHPSSPAAPWGKSKRAFFQITIRSEPKSLWWRSGIFT